jgi:hypothetical protein
VHQYYTIVLASLEQKKQTFEIVALWNGTLLRHIELVNRLNAFLHNEALGPNQSIMGMIQAFAYEVGPHHRTKHEHFYDTNMSPYLFPFLWNCMVWTVDVDGLHPYIPFLCKKVSNHVHTPVHNT